MISKQNRRDMVTYAVLWMASIIIYFILIPRQIVLRNSWSGNTGFNSQTFPRLLSVCLCVVSMIGIIETWNKIRKEKAAAQEEAKDGGTDSDSLYVRLMPAIIFGLCILYRILFAQLGFIIASAIIIPVMLLLFHCRKWQYYLSSFGFMIALYIAFKIVLRVPLP